MMLTWKDGVTTLFMGAIVAVYATFLHGTSLWLISSARGTTAEVMVLGIIGGCALGAVGDLYTGTRSRPTHVFVAIATTLGVIALAAGVIGLITASTAALAVLVAATIALWLTATIRHAFTISTAAPAGRDVHEVIHPEDTARR